jgi:hypothetical protein
MELVDTLFVSHKGYQEVKMPPPPAHFVSYHEISIFFLGRLPRLKIPRRRCTFIVSCVTIEMKYLLLTAGYTLFNHKRNEEILEELLVTPLEDKLCTYRHKWFQHVHRTEDSRLPKQLLNYHPIGIRRPGRPLKRLLDDMTAEAETGHPGLNS